MTTSWSRFVTSSPFPVFSVMSAIFLSLFLRSQIVILNVLLLMYAKVMLLAFKPLLHNPFL